MMDGNAITIGGLLLLMAAFIAIIRSFTAPLDTRISGVDEALGTRISSVEKTMKDDAERARLELDKAERGLKDLTTRAETIIRQTVEDVDTKLRREAELIEEKTRIQFLDMQRQLDAVRQFADMQRQIEQIRIDVIRLRDGTDPPARSA